jgi:hypothetical protein
VLRQAVERAPGEVKIQNRNGCAIFGGPRMQHDSSTKRFLWAGARVKINSRCMALVLRGKNALRDELLSKARYANLESCAVMCAEW